MVHIASDLHLGHENIIEYTDRPFESVSEMNRTLVDNWNNCVDPDERVIFLGDLAPFEEQEHVVQGWLNDLNGDFVFIEGNHDPVVPIPSRERATLSIDGYDLYLTHRPEHVPSDWDGWAFFGHHHNNLPEQYPFIDPESKHVNVSIELLGFEPIPVTEIFQYLDAGEHHLVRPGVDPSHVLQEDSE